MMQKMPAIGANLQFVDFVEDLQPVNLKLKVIAACHGIWVPVGGIHRASVCLQASACISFCPQFFPASIGISEISIVSGGFRNFICCFLTCKASQFLPLGYANGNIRRFNQGSRCSLGKNTNSPGNAGYLDGHRYLVSKFIYGGDL